MHLLETIILMSFLITGCTTDVPDYDEDIIPPVPEVILNHSPVNQPALQFLAYVGNCTCRHNPRTYIVCYGSHCTSFPSTLVVNAPLFKIKLSSITTINIDDLQLLTDVEYLEIESNTNLVKIMPGCFRNLKGLRNLTISFNRNLKHLDENVFEGLTSLSTVCLQKNGFTRVLDITIALSIKYVPHLYLLEMNENVFHQVGATEFHPMNGTRLQQLNMVLCEIEYIHPDTLAPLKYLLSLRLGQNQFNDSVIARLVSRSVELGIPINNLNLFGMGVRKNTPHELLEAVGKSNITFLHLTSNNIEILDDNSFPSMPNLVQLSLRENHITDITLNAFKKISNLRSLFLSLNKLTQIPQGAILTSLYEFDVAANTYNIYYPSFIPDGIFKPMSLLRNLQLAYNNLGSLSKNTFVGLSNLVQLNLKNTSLTRIEPGLFLPLKNLLHLNLINNPFPLYMPMSADIFYGLNKLQRLLLGGCSLQNLTVSPSLFTYTPNLIHLGLERNDLFTISSNLLKSLNFLQSLSIASNKMAPWNRRILPSSSQFKIFNAKQNKFTYITETMMNEWKNLETLELEGNSFSCDCSLYTAVSWMRNNKLSISYTDGGENFVASCINPPAWRGKSIMLYMDVYKNDDSYCETNFIMNKTLLTFLLTLLVATIVVGVLCYVYRWHIEYWMFIMRITLRKHNMWNIRRLNMFQKELNCTYDAFVSYCNEDREFVMELVDKMENNDPFLKLCVYERDFQLGAVISEAVVRSIASSRRTILVVSTAFARSQWCRWETQLAEYHQIFFRHDTANAPDDTLLIVKLEPVDREYLTPVLKYLLKTRIYLQWDSDTTKQKLFWEKLRCSLSSNENIND